jgi:xanthine dehydrogenase YagS FAD-binding subunit
MRTFDYVRPKSIDEALTLLQAEGDNHTEALAGGTDLLTLMKSEIATPTRLIDLKRLDALPDEITEAAGGVTLGALTTLADIEKSTLLQERYPLLSAAAGLAATPQLRNMATIGGNLLQRPRCWYFRNNLIPCWLKGGEDCPAQEGENQFHALFGDSPCVAVHPSDLASALLALDATVRTQSANGEATLPLADFYTLPTDARRQETVLTDDELILAIDLPAQRAGTRSTYLKAMDRKVWSFALVGVAVVVQMNGQTVDDLRIVLSGVAPIPWRVGAAEALLRGQRVSNGLIDQAAEAAVADAQPLQHNGYKVPLARQLVRRALHAVTG